MGSFLGIGYHDGMSADVVRKVANDINNRKHAGSRICRNCLRVLNNYIGLRGKKRHIR